MFLFSCGVFGSKVMPILKKKIFSQVYTVHGMSVFAHKCLPHLCVDTPTPVRLMLRLTSVMDNVTQ